MNIRLAFTGASGTGKTTLATALSHGLNFKMCPVGSRSVSQAMGFASPYDVDAAGKRSEFQRQLLDQKRAWELVQSDHFVTDRTHLDNLAYTLGHAPHLGTDPEFVRNVQDGMERYTHIVFCPISSVFAPGDDSARVSDRDYHKAYEAVLIDLLFKHVSGVPILWLTSRVNETRIRQVTGFLNS